MKSCPLCNFEGDPFYKDQFFLCPNCKGIFKNRKLLLDNQDEKERYELHSDDPNDKGYQSFVSPIINHTKKFFLPNKKGLDFGTGQSQIVAMLLKNEGYDIKLYDPYFAPFSENLELQYDFITACEVIEHFNDPKEEFTLLNSLLDVGGELICMTHLYDESIDFAKWYYKNDSTHIFIYQKETIEYIQKNFGFSSYMIEKRLVVFKK